MPPLQGLHGCMWWDALRNWCISVMLMHVWRLMTTYSLGNELKTHHQKNQKAKLLSGRKGNQICTWLTTAYSYWHDFLRNTIVVFLLTLVQHRIPTKVLSPFCSPVHDRRLRAAPSSSHHLPPLWKVTRKCVRWGLKISWTKCFADSLATVVRDGSLEDGGVEVWTSQFSCYIRSSS